MEVKKGLGIPVGPRDLERLEWYERKFVPQLAEVGWLPTIELKGKEINPDEEWVRRVVTFCESNGGSLQWHANDEIFSALGRGLTVEKAIGHLAQVESLVREHNCKIVLHFGAHSWPSFDHETPEPILPPLRPQRFVSPISAAEYLEQLEAHVPVVRAIAEHFGPDMILGENTHLNLNLTGIAQYNAMQYGTPLFIEWLRAQTGIGTLLDIEHYHELLWLLRRRGLAGKILPNSLCASADCPLSESQKKVEEITGIIVEKGKVPSTTRGTLIHFESLLQIFRPKCFHIGGTGDSLDKWGALNAHLPVSTLDDARRVRLPLIIYQSARRQYDCRGQWRRLVAYGRLSLLAASL